MIHNLFLSFSLPSFLSVSVCVCVCVCVIICVYVRAYFYFMFKIMSKTGSLDFNLRLKLRYPRKEYITPSPSLPPSKTKTNKKPKEGDKKIIPWKRIFFSNWLNNWSILVRLGESWKIAYGLIHLFVHHVHCMHSFDQMNVRAVDDGGLTSAPGTLTVNVIRNDFTPEILNMPDSISVRSDISLTQMLFTCVSRDNDTQVSCECVLWTDNIS